MEHAIVPSEKGLDQICKQVCVQPRSALRCQLSPILRLREPFLNGDCERFGGGRGPRGWLSRREGGKGILTTTQDWCCPPSSSGTQMGAGHPSACSAVQLILCVGSDHASGRTPLPRKPPASPKPFIQDGDVTRGLSPACPTTPESWRAEVSPATLCPQARQGACHTPAIHQAWINHKVLRCSTENYIQYPVIMEKNIKKRMYIYLQQITLLYSRN